MTINRREFMLTGAAAGAAAAAAQAQTSAPAVRSGGGRPLVISSANGYQYKNGGSQTCVERAFAMITEGKDCSTP